MKLKQVWINYNCRRSVRRERARKNLEHPGKTAAGRLFAPVIVLGNMLFTNWRIEFYIPALGATKTLDGIILLTADFDVVKNAFLWCAGYPNGNTPPAVTFVWNKTRLHFCAAL
jgi:hypothetical protein